TSARREAPNGRTGLSKRDQTEGGRSHFGIVLDFKKPSFGSFFGIERSDRETAVLADKYREFIQTRVLCEEIDEGDPNILHRQVRKARDKLMNFGDRESFGNVLDHENPLQARSQRFLGDLAPIRACDLESGPVALYIGTKIAAAVLNFQRIRLFDLNFN